MSKRATPLSETVEAAWGDMALDIDTVHPNKSLLRGMEVVTRHRLRIEAAIRAATLDEARAAVEELSANDPVMLAGAWRESVLRRIDALREGER